MDSFIVIYILLALQVVISLDLPILLLPSYLQEGKELSFKCRYYRIQDSLIPVVEIKL